MNRRSDISGTNKIILGWLYIVTMAIAFSTRHGIFAVGTIPQLSIGIFWIVVAFIKLANNRFDRRKHIIFQTFFFLELFLLPQIVIHLFFFIQVVLGTASLTSFSLNLTTYIPCLLGVLSVYLFKHKALYYTVISMILAWLVAVCSAIAIKGFFVFTDAIKEAYISNYYLQIDHPNYLEIHDIVLAIGFLIIYYLYINDTKLTRRNVAIFTGAIVIMFLGMKRIVVLALIVISVITVMLKRISNNRKHRLFIIAGYCVIALSYLFIYAVSLMQYTEIQNIASAFGINHRGRLYYYYAIMNLGSFSPSYIGIGRNVIVEHLANELSYLRITAAHGDILKIYIEEGFVMFGWWLWYTLVRIPQRLKRYYSVIVANVYFILCLYTYILNLTDNVDTYFACRIIPIQIVMISAMFEHDAFNIITAKHITQLDNIKYSDYTTSTI